MSNIFDDEPRVQTRTRNTADDRIAQEVLEGETRLASLPQAGTSVAGSSAASDLAQLIEIVETRQRDHNAIAREAQRIGERMGERGLYSFPVGKGRAEGPTIWLMEALSEAWGYLDIDVEVAYALGDEVDLRVRVIDLLRVKRTVRPYRFTMSPAPGKFASNPEQANRWRVMQFQVGTSKAVRTALEHALPRWVTDIAVDAARSGAAKRYLKGKSVQEAVSDAIAAYQSTFNVDQAALEFHIGSARALWTVIDVVDLRKLYDQLKKGERTVDAVFGGAPAPTDSAAQGGLAGVGQKAEPKQDQAPADTPKEEPASKESDDGPSTEESADDGSSRKMSEAEKEKRRELADLAKDLESSVELQDRMAARDKVFGTKNVTIGRRSIEDIEAYIGELETSIAAAREE